MLWSFVGEDPWQSTPTEALQCHEVPGWRFPLAGLAHFCFFRFHFLRFAFCWNQVFPESVRILYASAFEISALGTF